VARSAVYQANVTKASDESFEIVSVPALWLIFADSRGLACYALIVPCKPDSSPEAVGFAQPPPRTAQPIVAYAPNHVHFKCRASWPDVEGAASALITTCASSGLVELLTADRASQISMHRRLPTTPRLGPGFATAGRTLSAAAVSW
jgi:hypothetical protein